MRKILCDRCGQEIPLKSRIGYVAVNWRAPSDESLMYENPYEGYDFCEQCMHDIVEVIDSICTHSEVIEEETKTPEEIVIEVAKAFAEAMNAAEEPGPDPDQEEEKEAEETEEEPEKEPEEPEEPVGRLADNPPPKQFVNLRELRELVKAGKKPKEIAEHFGISMASYYNYKKKAEAMWNAGML